MLDRTYPRVAAALLGIGAAALVAGCSSAKGGSGAGPTAETSSADFGSASNSASAAPSSDAVVTSGGQATVTVVETVTPPPATDTSTKPGIFVGTWSGHGRDLVVAADGSATVNYRIYTFCSENPTPPCDNDSGNTLIDGGKTTLKITKVVTANHMSVATATVLTATDPKIAIGSTETFTLNGDIIASDYGTLCDAKANAVGGCGA